MNAQIDALIREVHVARKQAAAAKVEHDKILADAKAAAAETGYPELKAAAAEITDQLRAQVVEAYQADPAAGKKIVGKIGVTTKDVVNYDPAAALKWAKEKGVFLQLNTVVFDDYALYEHEQLDFVTKIPNGKVTASIPANLTATIEILNADA